MCFIILAIPSVLEDPKDTTILVNETLNTTCVYKAKPKSAVTWIYNMSENPNSEVINISSTEQSDGPYMKTTSIISWKTSEENQRKAVSGFYTCTAENTVGTTSHTMKLDIQCNYQ